MSGINLPLPKNVLSVKCLTIMFKIESKIQDNKLKK